MLAAAKLLFDSLVFLLPATLDGELGHSAARNLVVTIVVTTRALLGGADWRRDGLTASVTPISVGERRRRVPPEPKVVGSNPAWRIELQPNEPAASQARRSVSRLASSQTRSYCFLA